MQTKKYASTPKARPKQPLIISPVKLTAKLPQLNLCSIQSPQFPHIPLSPRYYYACLFPQGSPSKTTRALLSRNKTQRTTKMRNSARFSLELPTEYEAMHISALVVKGKEHSRAASTKYAGIFSSSNKKLVLNIRRRSESTVTKKRDNKRGECKAYNPAAKLLAF